MEWLMGHGDKDNGGLMLTITVITIIMTTITTTTITTTKTITVIP